MILLKNTIILIINQLKLNLFDVKDNTYIGFKKEVNDKNLKFKVGNQVRISKNKKYFC